MADAFLILSEPLAAPHLALYVRNRAGRRRVRVAVDQASLRTAVRELPHSLRLIAFCSNTIVPASIINSLSLTPYNIHPGGPDFPGVKPDYFAHARGACTFGATAHEMISAVDAGPIVATALAPMPIGATPEDYGNTGFNRALDLFRFIVDYTVVHDAALPPLPGARWRGPYNTLADYRAQFGSSPALAPSSRASHQCSRS